MQFKVFGPKDFLTFLIFFYLNFLRQFPDRGRIDWQIGFKESYCTCLNITTRNNPTVNLKSQQELKV